MNFCFTLYYRIKLNTWVWIDDGCCTPVLLCNLIFDGSFVLDRIEFVCGWISDGFLMGFEQVIRLDRIEYVGWDL